MHQQQQQYHSPPLRDVKKEHYLYGSSSAQLQPQIGRPPFKLNLQKINKQTTSPIGSYESFNGNSGRVDYLHTTLETYSPIEGTHRETLSVRDRIELIQSRRQARDQEFNNHFQRLDTITLSNRKNTNSPKPRSSPKHPNIQNNNHQSVFKFPPSDVSIRRSNSQETEFHHADNNLNTAMPSQFKKQQQQYHQHNFTQPRIDSHQNLLKFAPYYESKLVDSISIIDDAYIPSHLNLQTKQDQENQQEQEHFKVFPEKGSTVEKEIGFIPKYFYSLESSISVGNEVLENGEIEWIELKFINVFLALIQEFTTSNFFVIPFAFYQGGFFYSNIFLFASFLLTAYPMIVLVNLKRLTNLTLRELAFVKWGYFGKTVADICVFFTHFSDLYQYVQGLSLMVSKIAIFIDVEITRTESFWIQLVLFYPLVCYPQFTNKVMLRYICDSFMAVGLFMAIFMDIELISMKEFSQYNFFKSVNIVQSAMNMFSCFEESISVYEIYRDKFTASQTAKFKRYIWYGHTIMYLLSALLCNLTWLAFQEKTQENIMSMYEDQSWVVFIAKFFFIIAAVPAYGHLFSPLDIINKDLLGIYGENNRMAYFRLKRFDRDHVIYFPKSEEMEGTNWFKLCYFHTLPVQEEMERLNKDSVSVKNNKTILFYVIKFLMVYFSIMFGMMTSDTSNAVFNVFQIFFKTPISLIFPCHLNLIFGNLSQVEKFINLSTVIIGYILTCTSFLFLSTT